MKKYRCLEDYIMENGEVAFEKGKIYYIEKQRIDYITKSNIGKLYLEQEDINNYFEPLQEPDETPTHYDNSKGSLYQFCENQQLNAYEFDIIKRVMRCRKKGNFIEDLEKTKFLIDLYIKEYEEKNNR
jgi:hypothetical protein